MRSRDALPLCEVECRVLRRPLKRVLRPLILWREFEGARYLVNEAGELLRGLGRDGLDVALKDEEVLGFDEDVVFDERVVVRAVSDNPIVELVLGRSGG